MKLFWYYSLHSFKNQLKKLFKTWIAVFIVACMVIGGIVGLSVAKFSEAAEEKNGGDSSIEEVIPPEDEPAEEANPIDVAAVSGLVCSGLLIMMFGFEFISGDKNGSKIFTMADVNLLFSAPMKPQSVLLFKLITQMGATLLASFYLLFQIPNLCFNMGFSVLQALSILLVWILSLVFGKLINVLVYTFTSTHESVKKYIRPVTYGSIFLLGAVFFTQYKSSGLGLYDFANAFFNREGAVYIPIYGQIKGFLSFAISGNAGNAVICILALVAEAALLVLIIWRIKADFYEDAMAKSAETAELMQAAATGNSTSLRRKKDRSDKLLRDGLKHGEGANIFFFKAMYNRFRFAKFGIFTKTTITYLVVTIGSCLVMQNVIKTPSITVMILILGGFAFFRSLGNPMSTDLSRDFFIMIPESTYKKMFYSLISGSAECLLDLIPSVLLSVIWLRGDPLFALCGMLFIVSIDFYSISVSTFIDVSIPVSAGKMVKNLVQIMFIYFGLLPIAGLIAVGYLLNLISLFILIAVLFSAAIGGLFFFFAGMLLSKGRK